MSLLGFRQALLAEIEHQQEVRRRMGDDNPAVDNGLMWQIRLERLDLLRTLLEFEAAPPSDAKDGGMT